MNTIHLSRRNLLTLLSKLDRAEDSYTECTLIKQKEDGRYPTTERTRVVAVEDDVYYEMREAGEVHPLDDPKLKEKIMEVNEVYMVICDCGDGSNSTEWVLDKNVIDKMEELVDDGDDRYSSGDGLQVKTLKFPAGFDIPAWLKTNYCGVTTMKDLE